jgi:hypothetical protein
MRLAEEVRDAVMRWAGFSVNFLGKSCGELAETEGFEPSIRLESV